jgi:hypothetical protein
MKKLLGDLRFIAVRTIRTPFINRHEKRLIVHCAHHKAGTVWITNVLRSVSRKYGLRFQASNDWSETLAPSTDVFIQNNSFVDISQLPPFRGSHLIRDPRDMVISGYFYHLWTAEPWVHIPMKKLLAHKDPHWPYFSESEFGDKTYQQYLKSMDQEEGILTEIRRSAGYSLKHMAEWDYANPDFIEIKYENLMTDWENEFTRVFAHFGFNEQAIKISLEVADKLSFKNVSKRRVGQVKEKSHLRSGRPGQWKDVFTASHKQKIKELFGSQLIQLGYEDDDKW